MPTDPALVGRLADALADHWRAGDPVPAERLLDAHPHLWADPPAALEVLAEELAQRDEHGTPASESELVRRFPDWGPQVRALLACQRALGGPPAPPFPDPGDRLGEFDLLDLLGKGGHGRVYRAAQPHLGGRRVVLKVGPDTGGEHLSLARLQHTHVVPLYSVHEFPERRLRGLCLPDFGGRTLADLLGGRKTTSPPGPLSEAERGWSTGACPWPTRFGTHAASLDHPLSASERGPGGEVKLATGADLLAAVGPAPAAGAAAGFLHRASLAEALCWIGACLAEALQSAHEHGLLHLDVKPSNVLVAADGTPMLLDFHLARGPLAAGQAVGEWVGGTPGHMAPEQDAAVSAVRQGRPVPQDVDARADVFALGRMLTAAAAAWGCRPSVGLADVLRRASDPVAARRYPTAGDLAADLRRHLADRPLRGVPNRSLVERWRKWRRRQPRALPAVAAGVGLLAVGAAGVAEVNVMAAHARTAAGQADRLLAAGKVEDAAGRLQSAAALADRLPFYDGLKAELREKRAAAERVLAADQLHTVAEQVRWQAAGDQTASGLARRCRELWDRHEQLIPVLTGQPTADLEDRWKADLFDVATLGRPPAADRAEAGRLLGLPAGDPRTGWEWLRHGRERLAAGDLDAAADAFDRAAALAPQEVWPHHYRGAVALRRNRPAEAAAAFGACVALAPEVSWCWHNRGQALQAAGDPVAAAADFDRAKRLGAGR